MTNTRDVLAHTKGGLTTGDSEIFAFIALSPLELLPTCQPPLQDPAGIVTRGLPIFESDASVHDRGGNAVRLLYEPPCAARQILLDGRQARTILSFRDSPAGPDPEPMNTGHSQGATGRCS